MATTSAPDTTEIDDAVLLDHVGQDPHKPGRHNARFKDYPGHLWSALGTWRRVNGDIAETARERGIPEVAVRAAVRYDERHKELFDAYFLLDEEEWRCRNQPCDD